MSVDKVSGKGDGVEPDKKGEKKLRDVGNEFKEIEKTGAVDPDNRRRRQQQSDLLADINTPQKKFNSTPPTDARDTRGPLKAPAGAKPFPKSSPNSNPGQNYIPRTPSSSPPANSPSVNQPNNSGSQEAPVHDEETYSPNGNDQNSDSKASSSASQEPKSPESKEKQEKKEELDTFETKAPKLKALSDKKEGATKAPKTSAHPEKVDSEKAKPHAALEKKPVEQVVGSAAELTQKKSPDKAVDKTPKKSFEKESDKAPAKSTEKKTDEPQKKKEGASPLTHEETVTANSAHAQPTIIVGAPAPAAAPPSHQASSQLSHPEVARLFDQMVSHMTAISSKGVKEVTITLSSGTFRGSQIVIRETSTALRNYNIELRGMTPQAEHLFQENAGALMQLFSTGKFPFTVHRLETRALIERKESVGEEKDDDEDKKE